MKVPIDGVMIRGHTIRMSEKYVYGESHPSPKRTIENSEPMKSCPIVLAEASVSSGCGWILSMAIGNDRYAIRNPPPAEGWSFDNSSNLSSSNISDDQKASFSDFVGSKLEFLYSAHSSIVAKSFFAVPATAVILIAAYFMMA